MCYTAKNVAQLEKSSAAGKLRHALKNMLHLEKCGAVGKMRYTEKMCHT